MDLFEFLMVLVSIIVGLGIAELLTGVARILRLRDGTKYYWVHAPLVATIFIALLQQWWEIWELRDASAWSFGALVLMLLGPTCLFLIAHLLFPAEGESLDIEAHYYGAMRPTWVLGGMAIVASTSFRPIYFDFAVFDPSNVTSFFGLAVFVILFVSRRRIVHSIIVPMVLLALLYDVLRWAPVLAR